MTIEYTKKFQLAIISNSSEQFFWCALNPTDTTKPFFIHPTQIEFISRIAGPRPNYPNQFVLHPEEIYSCSRNRFETQRYLYNMETHTMIQEFNKAIGGFVGPNSVFSDGESGLKIVNLFEDGTKREFQIGDTGLYNVISEDSFFYVVEHTRKLYLCWPWDEQKENEEIDIPMTELEDIGRGMCSENVIYLIVNGSDDTRHVHMYDIEEGIWMERIDVTEFCKEFPYRVFVCNGDVVISNCGFGENVQVCAWIGKEGIKEVKEFPLPSGYEDGVYVKWI